MQARRMQSCTCRALAARFQVLLALPSNAKHKLSLISTASLTDRRAAQSSRGLAAGRTASTAAETDGAGTMSIHSQHELLQRVAQLVPDLAPDKYKGQAGKIAVVGGCREYTGAPFFASMAALKIGADLSHVFCTDGAATVIKGYSPELIVHPYLPDSWQAQQAQQGQQGRQQHQTQQQHEAADAIDAWLDRFDAVLVGPGLGRDPLTLGTVAEVMRGVRRRCLPMVVDADGLWLVNQDLSLVQGYRSAVLTPNKVEFQRLAAKLGVDADSPDALQHICQSLDGPVVVRKGKADVVGDGQQVVTCEEEGSPRRAGGQGDVLSGCIATFAAWAQRAGGASKEQLHEPGSSGGGDGSGGASSSGSDSSGALPPLMLAAYAGCVTTRRASRRAFARQRRSMGAADLLDDLGAVADELAGEC